VSDIERHKAASRRLYEEIFGRGNLAAADEILAADCVAHGPGSPPDHGTASIKRQAMLLRGAMPDFMVTLLDQVAEGDRVSSRWRAAGTFTAPLAMPSGALPPTGASIAFEEIRVDRHADGRIAESWFIPDRFTFWQALGLIPNLSPREDSPGDRA
jgi:predicted ester cyclase